MAECTKLPTKLWLIFGLHFG